MTRPHISIPDRGEAALVPATVRNPIGRDVLKPIANSVLGPILQHAPWQLALSIQPSFAVSAEGQAD